VRRLREGRAGLGDALGGGAAGSWPVPR
jgi:hypothetical protein